MNKCDAKATGQLIACVKPFTDTCSSSLLALAAFMFGVKSRLHTYRCPRAKEAASATRESWEMIATINTNTHTLSCAQ